MLLHRGWPAISAPENLSFMTVGERTVDGVKLAVALLLVGLAYWFGLR